MNLDEMVEKFDAISKLFGSWSTAPQLEIRMRYNWDKKSRFYAMLENVWVSEGDKGGAVGSYGNGSTPEEAMEDYLRKIAGETLIYRINTKREIRVVVA
jgi:hypothetical protein